LISEVTCAESSCTTLGLVAALGGLGAASGAVLGALVGLAIPRWRLRFP
jgi:ABC-type branched-subunit amino acid transport system permease subunit